MLKVFVLLIASRDAQMCAKKARKSMIQNKDLTDMLAGLAVRILPAKTLQPAALACCLAFTEFKNKTEQNRMFII